MKKLVFVLPMLILSSEAFGSQFVLPPSAQKGLIQKELLDDYAKFRKDAEFIIRAFDETAAENRNKAGFKSLIDDAWREGIAFDEKFKKNKNAVIDQAKRDEIEMTSEALNNRLQKIQEWYYHMMHWAPVYPAREK